MDYLTVKSASIIAKMETNPAALALALLLGHEARITDEQWSEVRAMSEQSLFEVVGQILEEESPCPACEAAARERDDLHALCDRQADILSRVAVALRGPEPPQTRWSHADVPERAARAQQELADLRAQIESLAREMETDDRAGKLAHWIISLRKIAEGAK